MDIQQQIDGQLAKIDAAKAVRNVGAEAAPDSAVIAGVKFNKPTVSHFWLFARMGDMPVKHPMDRGVAVAYALSCESKDVRNRLFAEVDDGSLVANAYDFMDANGIGPGDLEKISNLASGVFGPVDPDEKKTTADLGDAGGL
jgi:hypothetical protein